MNDQTPNHDNNEVNEHDVNTNSDGANVNTTANESRASEHDNDSDTTTDAGKTPARSKDEGHDPNNVVEKTKERYDQAVADANEMSKKHHTEHSNFNEETGQYESKDQPDSDPLKDKPDGIYDHAGEIIARAQGNNIMSIPATSNVVVANIQESGDVVVRELYSLPYNLDSDMYIVHNQRFTAYPLLDESFKAANYRDMLGVSVLNKNTNEVKQEYEYLITKRPEPVAVAIVNAFLPNRNLTVSRIVETRVKQFTVPTILAAAAKANMDLRKASSIVAINVVTAMFTKLGFDNWNMNPLVVTSDHKERQVVAIPELVKEVKLQQVTKYIDEAFTHVKDIKFVPAGNKTDVSTLEYQVNSIMATLESQLEEVRSNMHRWRALVTILRARICDVASCVNNNWYTPTHHELVNSLLSCYEIVNWVLERPASDNGVWFYNTLSECGTPNDVSSDLDFLSTLIKEIPHLQKLQHATVVNSYAVTTSDLVTEMYRPLGNPVIPGPVQLIPIERDSNKGVNAIIRARDDLSTELHRNTLVTAVGSVSKFARQEYSDLLHGMMDQIRANSNTFTKYATHCAVGDEEALRVYSKYLAAVSNVFRLVTVSPKVEGADITALGYKAGMTIGLTIQPHNVKESIAVRLSNIGGYTTAKLTDALLLKAPLVNTTGIPVDPKFDALPEKLTQKGICVSMSAVTNMGSVAIGSKFDVSMYDTKNNKYNIQADVMIGRQFESEHVYCYVPNTSVKQLDVMLSVYTAFLKAKANVVTNAADRTAVYLYVCEPARINVVRGVFALVEGCELFHRIAHHLVKRTMDEARAANAADDRLFRYSRISVQEKYVWIYAYLNAAIVVMLQFYPGLTDKIRDFFQLLMDQVVSEINNKHTEGPLLTSLLHEVHRILTKKLVE